MSAHFNDFAYGWLTPTLAYLFSFLGCLTGLKATARARLVSGPQRARWLALAAVAIGGTGIWVMHFVAMLGFSVSGTDVRYNLPVTIASWLTAVVVVGMGLFAVGYGRPSAVKVIIAGCFTGIGVAAMHYTGVGAMQMDGVKSYDRTLVIVSVVIAVVASIVAFWFVVTIRRTIGVIVAAAIMALAVCSMHYTGIAAMRVRLNTLGAPVPGINPLTLMVPIFVFVTLVVIALAYGMLNSISEDDAADLDALSARINGSSNQLVDRAPRSSGFRLRQGSGG
jgi:NO-binding membrane sensor protein with MHYT domain